MRRTTSTTNRTRRLAGALVTVGIGTGLLAGCGGTAGPETGATVDEIQEADDGTGAVDPGAGTAAEDDVTSYVGQRVTVSAEVNEVLSPNAFTIAGTAGSGGADELLIVSAPTGTPVTEEDVVAVTGTVREELDLAALETEYGYDDDDALYGDFGGEPYIVAEKIDPTVAEPGATTIEPAA
jgi:hypothetical protein